MSKKTRSFSMSGLTKENQRQRGGRITASAFPYIAMGGTIGIDHERRIACERIGVDYPRDEPTEAMVHGTRNEASVAAFLTTYWQGVDDKVRAVANDEFDDGGTGNIGATPDMYLRRVDDDAVTGIIQIKSPFSKSKFTWCSRTPDPMHVRQVNFERWVIGKTNDLACDDGAWESWLCYALPTPQTADDIALHLVHRKWDAEAEWIESHVAAAEKRIAVFIQHYSKEES